MSDRAPVLVFSWGNPSRGDDALGPSLYDMIERRRQREDGFAHVEALTDYQLQVEHAIDLQDRRWILFADASADAPPPFAFERLEPAREVAFTTHSMSPAGVLAVYRDVYRRPPPPAFLLSIRGYAFDLGQPLSSRARQHLESAFEFLLGLPPELPFAGPSTGERHCG